jgi:hypothetical protein
VAPRPLLAQRPGRDHRPGARGVQDDRGSGTVSGMVGPNAITLSLHASGVFDGSTCDTWPVSLTLDQHAI